jgi:hypothetical protein
VQLALGAGIVLVAVNGWPTIGAKNEPSRATSAAGAAGSTAAGGAATAQGAARPNRFNAHRAFALIREQVERYGPRPAGSAASRRLATRLRRLLPGGRFEAVPGGLRNIVSVVRGRRPAVVIGAHYDVDAHPPGFVGANDGAAGTAAVVELARSLRKRAAGARELRFVLFDGEEEPLGTPDSEFYDRALRGSKAYVRAHARAVGKMVLLDYIANRDLQLPREASSDPVLWEQLRVAARRVGALAYFPEGEQLGILDDHTPFLRAGIPAIDLIDFSYRYRDTVDDTVDKLSLSSLDAVGESVAQLAVTLP